MTSANPLPTYPDDEIPVTDRHWRERWAGELTRANHLERENEELRTKLASIIGRDSRNVDDLTDHCARQGAYIDRLQREVNSLAYEVGDLRAQLVIAWAGPSGKDCDECGGTGYVEDELMCGDPGADLGYRITEVVDQCDACFGHGRVQS